VALTGEIPKVQATPSCVTVNVRPAIVSVPVRADVVVFAATEYPTEPEPLPLAPDVIEIHEAELEAVQLHDAAVVTATEPVVAPAATDVALGAIEKVQPAPCVTVNVCPAIVSVADRCAVVVFAATEYETVPLPLPAAPAVTVSHEALLVADQVHPVTAVTATVPVEVPPPTEMLVGEMEELHGEENAKVLDCELRPVPVGPTAAIRASYVVPAAGQGFRSVVKSTRTTPSV